MGSKNQSSMTYVQTHAHWTVTVYRQTQFNTNTTYSFPTGEQALAFARSSVNPVLSIRYVSEHKLEGWR